MISYHEGIVGVVAIIAAVYFIRDRRNTPEKSPAAQANNSNNGRRIAAAIAVVVAVAAIFLASSSTAADSVPWSMRLLDRAARVVFFVCGMGGEGYGGGKSLAGGPWRACYERLRPRVGPGDWGGVASVDVNVTDALIARVHTPHGNGNGDSDGDSGAAARVILVMACCRAGHSPSSHTSPSFT